MSSRPLVRRKPDGTRYVARSDLLKVRPRYSSGLPPQPGSQNVIGPEPTPPPTPARSPRERVSDDDVLGLRAEWATGKWSQTELAYIYGLGYHVVRGILLGNTYIDVKPAPEEQD